MEKKSNIQSFSIYGLFDKYDVSIPFESDIKILVGENGLGKTTILDMFNLFLTNPKALSNYPFHEIEMSFTDRTAKKLKKNGVRNAKPVISQAISVNHYPTYRRIEKSRDFLELEKSTEKQLRSFVKENGLSPIVFNKLKMFLNHAKFKTIAYSLEDVTERFKSYKVSIDRMSVSFYEQFRDELLQNIAKGIKIDNNEIEIKKDDILIVLSSLATLESVKNDLLNVLEKGRVTNENMSQWQLLYGLQNIYNKRKKLDTCAENFVSIANKYLIDKKIRYNAENFHLEVETNNGTISLDQLSSGEKQLISIFSHIYLPQFRLNKKTGLIPKDVIAIIDEPELSMSIDWQKNFLPDIWNSGHCQCLFVATHSPFVFKNKFDTYTYDLENYLQKAK